MKRVSTSHLIAITASTSTLGSLGASEEQGRNQPGKPVVGCRSRYALAVHHHAFSNRGPADGHPPTCSTFRQERNEALSARATTASHDSSRAPKPDSSPKPRQQGSATPPSPGPANKLLTACISPCTSRPGPASAIPLVPRSPAADQPISRPPCILALPGAWGMLSGGPAYIWNFAFLYLDRVLSYMDRSRAPNPRGARRSRRVNQCQRQGLKLLPRALGQKQLNRDQ